MSDVDVPTLAALLQETARRHGAFEEASPPHDWWDWYAGYLHTRLLGGGSAEAAAAADLYMAQTKGVIRGTGGEGRP